MAPDDRRQTVPAPPSTETTWAEPVLARPFTADSLNPQACRFGGINISYGDHRSAIAADAWPFLPPSFATTGGTLTSA